MIVMGVVAGAIVWAFLFVMDLLIGLIWGRLPAYFDFVFLPLVICVIGGFVIGIYQKVFGTYPESLDTVLAKVKKDGRYEYKNIMVYSTAALLPLIFGASVGPEAGLTGTIAGICTWVGDRMKRFGTDFKHMTEIGVAAALSSVFTAPLFGFAAPLFGKTSAGRKRGDEQAIKGMAGEETEEEISLTLPKTWKIVV